MPTYDYQCQHCGNSFDAIRKIAERLSPEDSPCPECGWLEVKFQVSAPLNSYMDPLRLGRIKPPSDFKETMNLIKKGNPDSKRLGLKNQIKDY